MRISDLLEEIYFALVANKVRSFLTVLGIVIGIGSVIGMVAIGQGAKGSIESSIESIGSNLLIVSPGTQRGVGMQVSSGQGSAQTLTQADADAIAQEISLVNQIAPELSRRYQVIVKGANTNTSIIGTTPAYTSVRKVEVEQGVFIDDQNLESAQKVAVIGPTVRDDLFGEGGEALGQIIRINGIQFKVVGITQSKGGTGFNNADNAIYVPLTTAQRFLAGDDYVTSISIEATDQQSMEMVKSQTTELLLARHNISDSASADFTITSQSDIVATASTVTNTFTMLLASIAGISLLVGGIGIMNMMLTTVTERTREIGLRKAIGAQRGDISQQFLMEAITLTLIGGLLGVVLGWLIAWGITKFSGTVTAVSWSSVLLAFGVSAAIGVIFGYYPASRASRLNPIDALKYE